MINAIPAFVHNLFYERIYIVSNIYYQACTGLYLAKFAYILSENKQHSKTACLSDVCGVLGTFQVRLFMKLLWFKKQLLPDLFRDNRRNLMKENIRELYNEKGFFYFCTSGKSCINCFSTSAVERVLLACATDLCGQFSGTIFTTCTVLPQLSRSSCYPSKGQIPDMY